jgi:hypothetical protein
MHTCHHYCSQNNSLLQLSVCTAFMWQDVSSGTRNVGKIEKNITGEWLVNMPHGKQAREKAFSVEISKRIGNHRGIEEFYRICVIIIS